VCMIAPGQAQFQVQWRWQAGQTAPDMHCWHSLPES
jgi:hypothetical protein